MDPPKGLASEQKTHKDKVKPLGDETDPELCNAHPARGLVGRREVEEKKARKLTQSHTFSNQGSWFCSASTIAMPSPSVDSVATKGPARPGFDQRVGDVSRVPPLLL